MNHPTDNIRCGSTVLRYYSAYGGWLLPDKSITRNVLTAYRAAEEAESRNKPVKADWELYEVELVMTRAPRTSAKSLAKKLDRTTSDVKNLIQAISER